MYLPPPETPAASFLIRVFYFLLPALCFCLFTEADVQQTQPGHRRDLGGGVTGFLSATWLGLHTWARTGSQVPPTRRERNPSPSKAGQPVERTLSGSLSPSLEGVRVTVIADGWQLGGRGSFYGINQRTQFLSLFPHLCLSEPLPGHWLPGKRDLIPRSGMESIMRFSFKAPRACSTWSGPGQTLSPSVHLLSP